MAKQMLMAGLKCPPDVGAQVMIAKAIPMAKAQPIWNRLPNTVTPRGFSKFMVKLATEAIPGKLSHTHYVSGWRYTASRVQRATHT